MKQIKDESALKLIDKLDHFRRCLYAGGIVASTFKWADQTIAEIADLIAELENAEAVPNPAILVAVWERDGAEYMMRVDAEFVPTENSTDIFFAIPDDYLAVKRKHGPPTRWERKPLSEYGKMYTSGDACEFFATEATA